MHLRKVTGDDHWRAPLEKTNKSIAKTVGYALLRPFQLLIWEFMCLSLDIYSAILLGVVYLFFGAFPLVFTTNHDFNLWQVGLSFSGLMVGMLAGGASFPVWHKIRLRLIKRREEETGVKGATEPEYRLPSVMFGALLVPIGLFWVGWTTYASVHFVVPIIGSAFFGAGWVNSSLHLPFPKGASWNRIAPWLAARPGGDDFFSGCMDQVQSVSSLDGTYSSTAYCIRRSDDCGFG